LSALEDHKPGSLPELLNPVFYEKVKDFRQKHGWSAQKTEIYFRKEGFSVSHNKINAVIKREKLTRKKMGKRPKPKYVRYEADNTNDQWHMDWSTDPLTKKKLLGIIDDKSRFMVFTGLFNSASAENTVIGLQCAIQQYGAPKEMVTDNGSHFKNIPKKRVIKELEVLEKKYGIKHIFIRVGHPQSNGKIERLFGSYKQEFPLMAHPDVNDCISWMRYYNFERIHQSLNYETPASVYLGCKPNSG
jgi:putative transposase